MADRGNDQHACHAGDGHQASKIEQQDFPAEDPDEWVSQQSNVADGEEDADFRWTEFPMGELKLTEGVGREVGLDGKH